jgi:small subunit ribosomal protein S16
MAVKIRLARAGAKKKPYYRMVVANATAPRDGDFIEKVGTYNPLLSKSDTSRVVIKKDRIAYWLSKGAQPTERVAKFLAAAGVELPSFVKKVIDVHLKTRKSKPSKKDQSE